MLRAVLRRLGAVAVACLVLAPSAEATTLVLLVGRGAIVVGADSMRTLAAGGRESVCKIHRQGGVVFGFAGAVSSERFDAAAIAAQQLAAGGTLPDQASRVAAAVQEALARDFKGTNAAVAQRELIDVHRGRPVTGFLATLTDGKPEVLLVLVEAAPAREGVTLTTRIERIDTEARDRAVFLSPQHQAVIDRAQKTVGRRRVAVKELVAAAEDLVQADLALEAQRPIEQRKSGPPITIAVLDGAGFRLETPGVCATGGQ
jgi:hypothetical protein